MRSAAHLPRAPTSSCRRAAWYAARRSARITCCAHPAGARCISSERPCATCWARRCPSTRASAWFRPPPLQGRRPTTGRGQWRISPARCRRWCINSNMPTGTMAARYSGAGWPRPGVIFCPGRMSSCRCRSRVGGCCRGGSIRPPFSPWSCRRIPVWPPTRTCCSGTRFTKTQVGLTHDQRRRNVAGAFSVPRGRRQRLAGRNVLLIDDVITTGATAEACARTLKRAGAGRVDVLTLAMVTNEALVAA